jgi:hypothetical protein
VPDACSALVLGLIAALAPALTAQGRVWVVDDGPLAADFSALQPAVDAAAEGDILLVMPGNYASFKITGKSLTVTAEHPGRAKLNNLFSASPNIEIADLAAASAS